MCEGLYTVNLVIPHDHLPWQELLIRFVHAFSNNNISFPLILKSGFDLLVLELCLSFYFDYETGSYQFG